MGTILEGDLDKSLEVIKGCLREVLKEVPRASTTIKIDARSDGSARMERYVKSVEDKL